MFVGKLKFIDPRFYIQKFPGLWQFFKFAVVGVSNTIVDWLVFFLIVRFIFTDDSVETYVKVFSFLIAMLNSYLWNTIWTFKKDYKQALGDSNNLANKKGSIFAKFAVVSIVGWIINVTAFDLVRFKLSSSQIVALIAASAAATFINFFANKFWTYRSKKLAQKNV